MKKLKIKSILFSVLCVSLFLLASEAATNAQWLENQSSGLCERLTNTHNQGLVDIFVIPDSNFIIMSDGYKDMISIDITSGKCRGYYKRDRKIYNPAVLQDFRKGGWNIYFTDPNGFFGVLHIDLHGIFDSERSLPLIFDKGLSIMNIAVPKREEVWFATSDKIICLNSRKEIFSFYQYPDGWNQNCSISKLFLTEDQNTMFIKNYIGSSEPRQIVMIDLSTGNSHLLTEPENGFFQYIGDIKEWKNHNGYFLFYKFGSLWTYNSLTDEFNIHIDGIESGVGDIMQSEDGKFMYLLGKAGDIVGSPDFYILDLEKKEIEHHILDFAEGVSLWEVSVLDNERNRILTTVISNADIIKPVFIDLNDFHIDYVPGIEFKSFLTLQYIKSDNKMIASGYSPFILIADLHTGEIKNSIPLVYKPDNWSTMKNGEYPVLLNNLMGYEFCHIKPPSERERCDIGVNPSTMIKKLSHFPDESGAIIMVNEKVYGSDYTYKEYYFKDKTYEDIELPYGMGKDNYPDLFDNQIISLTDNHITLIKPHGRYYVITVPNDEEIPKQNHFTLYDPDNNNVWVCNLTQSDETFLYKFSVSTNTIIDSFKIGDKFLNWVENKDIDPVNGFIYLIDRVTDLSNMTSRILYIIDLKSKSIAKQFVLQKNLDFESIAPTRVLPGIVPIPEMKKVFLWDHYRPWCIDLEKMEPIYGGEAKDNPQAGSIYEHVKGIWNQESGKAIVVDLTSDSKVIERNKKRVYEFDIETGNIVSEVKVPDSVTKVFFPKDKDKIWFLSPDETLVNTLHLHPAWDEPATISPSTNFIQYSINDKAKFSVHIQNPYDYKQKVFAYIWLITPKSDMLFLSYDGVYSYPKSISVTLPENLDFNWDVLKFTIPEIMPEGFYNFNAVLINEHGDRGPIGTWNFYVKD
jgi:hypothetical protein